MTADQGVLARPASRPLRWWAETLAYFVLIAGLSVAAVQSGTSKELADRSCKIHLGTFTSAFSPDFDIRSLDCHMPSIGNSPIIQFWAVSPYVGIKC
jgi:hypothetical protein